MQRFDVIVIGTGVAGQTAASELADAGRRVAIVDEREIGGTCALRGCEPKKDLYAAAEAVERVRGQAGDGVAGTAAVDWPALMAFKASFTDPKSARIERWLVDSGVTVLKGAARFTSSDRIEVDGEPLGAERFVVATGSAPITLGIDGEDLVTTSEEFMASKTLNERVVFIGGGFISFEFAHIAAAAGAQATIVHRGSRVLKGFDPDLAEMLVGGYRDAGIDVRMNAPVAAVRRAGTPLEIALADGTVIECDTVVHGAGRAPDIARLDPDAAGVAFGRCGVEVDRSMRSTTNPRVFAAGDAAALGSPLTPVGIAQARVARANILAPGSAVFDPKAIPSVVFSAPPLASVGVSEVQAKAEGLDVQVKLTDMSAWETTRRVGVRAAGAKTIVERDSGRIVGAHFLGHGAEEVVNVVATAIAGGLTAADLKSAIWAYPTESSNLVYLF